MEILSFILVLVGVIVVAGLVYLALLPGGFEARVSMQMNAPVGQIYNQVADLKTWPSWSPWLMHEPKTKLTYSGKAGQEGSSFSWDGKYVGAGTLTHIRLKNDKAIQSRIDFTRPFRSSSESGWEFAPKDKGTEVHWYMKGHMPFFFRFMTKRTKQMIITDYEIGLAFLNQRVDKAAPKFQLGFEGKESLRDFWGWYDSYKGTMEGLPSALGNAFQKLMSQVKQDEIKPTAKPCVVYHKMNPRTGTTVCDSVVPVRKEEKVQPIRQYSGGLYFHTQLKGDYKYLKHAWYAAASHTRMKKMKVNWSRPSLEVYTKNPFDTEDSSQYVTDLYIPLRS